MFRHFIPLIAILGALHRHAHLHTVRSQVDMLAQIPGGSKGASYADTKHTLHTRIYEAYAQVN
jgi:hypothetical protein